MKKYAIFWSVLTIILFWEIFFKGFVAVPTDTLVGANLPWRDYSWGYSTGVPVKNPPLSDVFSQFFVWKHLAADILKSGQLPLWNRYSFSGNALLATYHTAVLFPAILLLVLLPEFWGWNLYILLSVLFSGLFMSWYLASRLKSTPAILIGSLIYALSGLMTTWAELGTAVWAMAFIPLLLLTIDRYAAFHKPLYLTSLSCLVFLVVAAGNVQVVTYLIPLVIIYTLALHSFSQVALRVFLSLALGLGLSALLIFPTAHFSGSSIRGAEQFSQTINYGLTGVGEMIRLWTPDFFGSPVTYNHWGSTSYHENSNFIGSVGITLVLSYLLFSKKSRFGKFFSCLLLLTLGLGYANPISHWLFSQNFPLLTFSSASRIFFITSLSASIISALCLESLRRVSLVPIIIIVLTAIFLKSVPAQHFSVSARNSLLPVGILMIIFLTRPVRLSPKLLSLLFLVLAVFELGRYFRKYNPLVPSRLVFPTTPIIDYLKDHAAGFRIINESDETIPPNTWVYYGLESPEGYDPLYSLNYSKFFKVAANDNYFAKPHRYLDMTDARPDYLDVLSVKYLVAKVRADTYLTPLKSRLLAAGWQKVFTDKSTEIYFNPHVLPKAVSISSYDNFNSESDLASALESAGFSPKTQIAFFPPVASLPANLVSAKINNISNLTNGLAIQYLATDSALLLVSQSYDPAWKATVNTIPVPVYRADGGLLGIPVPPGANMLLKLKYFPDSLLIGAVISLISGTLVLASAKIRS